MVNFSVFNELSLPLEEHEAQSKFIEFFILLSALKQSGLSIIRMSNDFKNYFILTGVNLQQFLGQQTDKDFKTRLKSFISNGVIPIESPLIQAEEEKIQNDRQSVDYCYGKEVNVDGLACADIFDTLAVSFKSDEKWNCHELELTKQILKEDGSIEQELIVVKHASNSEHIEEHKLFFNAIEVENKLNITQNNFWDNREANFPKIIIFCPEVESQIKDLNKDIFQQLISILRQVETRNKTITEFNCSGEGQTAKSNPKLRSQREFTINGKKILFENHVKSFPNGYRMYFLQEGGKIHIGSIAKHFSTGKHK